MLLDGVFYSYQFIPLDQAWVNFGDENIMQYAGKTLALMFAIAFQMSIPVVGAIFLVDVALGIVARTVPQLNIFVVGVPVKIVVGLIMLIIVMGAIMASVSNLFSTILTTMRDMMNLMGG